jgi:HJR/Mrr/RecB family endonuclease
VFTGMDYYGCDNAIVITNSNFTENAINLAKSLNVQLINRDKVYKMMSKLEDDD